MTYRWNFRVSEAWWVRLFTPFRFPHTSLTEKDVYSLNVKVNEVPEELHPHLRVSDRDGIRQVQLRTRSTPLVIPQKGQTLSAILQCARDSNMPLDRLFWAVPLEVAVELVCFEKDTPERGIHTVMTPLLRAVRAPDVSVLRKRYDDVCAEAFEGS